MDPVLLATLTRIPEQKAMPVRSAVVAPSWMTTKTWRTELNISGSGYLHGVTWSNSQQSPYSYVRVTIDGGTPQVVGSLLAGMGVRGLPVSKAVSGETLGAVRFKTALKVEVYNDYGGDANVGTVTTYSLI